MKLMIASAIATVSLTTTAFAEGDVEKGESAFKKCKACHTITSPEGEVIFKGGRTGPNLYGVIGRVAGSIDFKYGSGLLGAKDAGFVWTEETLVEYTKDPKKWLGDNGFDSKSKMTYKLKKGGEDVAAYLASVAPAADAAASE
ncbi:c-type cytochrome [Shimia abyssi]|uniref:Cytochrome c n=1 Tax=Shimia abyssi TaxID=1662395 RepID=A0A2P8FB66_9RHOB|nr:cytochrome C [Shimia abyssi]PSL18965.1 cytochrome c [Shimia abyssi]